MIKFHCECCGKHQPVEIEVLSTDNLNPNLAWGDVVCQECSFVIATISTDTDKQGKYEFVMTKTLEEVDKEFKEANPHVVYREKVR